MAYPAKSMFASVSAMLISFSESVISGAIVLRTSTLTSFEHSFADASTAFNPTVYSPGSLNVTDWPSSATSALPSHLAIENVGASSISSLTFPISVTGTASRTGNCVLLASITGGVPSVMVTEMSALTAFAALSLPSTRTVNLPTLLKVTVFPSLLIVPAFGSQYVMAMAGASSLLSVIDARLSSSIGVL